MVKEPIQAIQQEIKNRFGFDAEVRLAIHDVAEDKAKQIIEALSGDFEVEPAQKSYENTKWYECHNPRSGRTFVIFYR